MQGNGHVDLPLQHGLANDLSIVVTPSLILINPERRRLIMPFSALSLDVDAVPPERMSSRSSSSMIMTSMRPTRPL
jgi:hypothetical protein